MEQSEVQHDSQRGGRLQTGKSKRATEYSK